MDTATAARRESREAVLGRYQEVRQATESLCAPLEPEDYAVQTIDDVSPAKWHLGHTTWFFERVILRPLQSSYRPVDPIYDRLFNSYYESFGPRVERSRRGWLARPTAAQVYDYRRAVDEALERFLRQASDTIFSQAAPLIELGCHHEQQHQELLLADLKHVFASTPLKPAYSERRPSAGLPTRKLPRWRGFPGGARRLGAGPGGFSFDNERPEHRAYVHEFELAERCVTNGEFLAFMEDGGYDDARLWLSDGWALSRRERWSAPLYWERRDGEWLTMTLSGPRSVERSEPVVHVSYYEAQAYAGWAGARLPMEAEWETAALELSGERGPEEGCFLDDGRFHPLPAGIAFWDLLGNVWEWTQSAYLPYPGYRPYAGALGEYNGKFMCGQMVLRGGSCATPRDHIRPSYRNFFQPEKRWQFSGLRLAR